MLWRQSKYVPVPDFSSLILTRPQLGSTTVGIRTPHGVVLAVEKRVHSPLLESSSIEKIMEIDTHLGCAMSGLTADARTMIDHARVTAQNHSFTYDEKIKVESVAQAVCDLALRFGESVHDEEAMMSRPFGVALLIAGIDELGPQLCVRISRLSVPLSKKKLADTTPTLLAQI
jgi:20S proteasome subunit alpha 5